MGNNHYPFENLPLPYAYDALEPFIDEKTMHLHHDKHLQTYIDNLNAALQDEPRLQALSLEQLIQCADRLPPGSQAAIRNNAGGVYNHRFFFEGMTNPAPQQPSGRLLHQINWQFGGVDAFKEAFKQAALSVFGSGYAWLVYGREGLRIVTTPNQDSPVQRGLCPVLVIDVWEHAYYLKHYNARAAYIDDWMDVIDWHRAERNLQDCLRPPC